MAGFTVKAIADRLGARVYGLDDVVVTGAASVSDAATGDIVLAENSKYWDAALKSAASAVVATADEPCGEKPVIHVENPREAFTEILRMLAPERRAEKPGIDPSAYVGNRLVCGDGVSIGYCCRVGDDVTIGEGTILHPFVYVGDGVKVGANSILHPGVVVYPGCELGSRVTVHAGTVIGADGFGYIPVGNELCKVPQIGKVVIEDDVEIGANTTIDRAKTGETRIGCGTKVDNLVQIAHNVKTGRSCVIVAQAGIAGSAELGNGVVIAGQAGLKDHVAIGHGATLAARAGAIGDVPVGAVYSGFPARPHREQLRTQAMISKLPEMQKTIEELRKEVRRLEERLAQLGGDRIEADSE